MSENCVFSPSGPFSDIFRTIFRHFSDILSTFPFSGLPNAFPVARLCECFAYCTLDVHIRVLVSTSQLVVCASVLAKCWVELAKLGPSGNFFVSNRGPTRLGRPGDRTTDMNGGSTVSYLARTPRIPFFLLIFMGLSAKGLLDFQGRLSGATWDRFPYTVETSPGHIWCRSKLRC